MVFYVNLCIFILFFIIYFCFLSQFSIWYFIYIHKITWVVAFWILEQMVLVNGFIKVNYKLKKKT